MSNYLQKCLTTAFAPTFRIFDALGFVGVPIIQSIFGDKITDNILADLVVCAVVGFVLVRLLVSPYLVWREDQALIGRLRLELDKPKLDLERHRGQIAIDLRSRMHEATAKYLEVTKRYERAAGTSTGPDDLYKEWLAVRTDFMKLAEMFLVNDGIYFLCQDIDNRAGIVVSDAFDNRDSREEKRELHSFAKELLEALKE